MCVHTCEGVYCPCFNCMPLSWSPNLFELSSAVVCSMSELGSSTGCSTGCSDGCGTTTDVETSSVEDDEPA